MEKEKEVAAWDLWARMYPLMMAGFIKEKMGFLEFKRNILRPSARYSTKSPQEIEEEMLAVVAAYEKKI